MELLKKENWWAWILLLIGTQGLSALILGGLLNVYSKDSWYAKWWIWVIGFACLFFPGLIMYAVFLIQITVKVASKLDVSGREIYALPYSWIICLIIPIIGWILFLVMLLYIEIFTIVKLSKGEGEKYIKS